jgi:hypothetical protein
VGEGLEEERGQTFQVKGHDRVVLVQALGLVRSILSAPEFAHVVPLRVPISVETPPSQVLAALDVGDVLIRATILVRQPFDGTPSFRLGSSLEVLLNERTARLSESGQYESGIMIAIGGSDLLTLTFDSGGSTVGHALLMIERMT